METLVAEEIAVGTVVKATFIPVITGTDHDTSEEGVLATGQNVTVTNVNKEFDGKITSAYAQFSRGSYTVEYLFTEWETLDQTTFLPEELKASLLAVQKQYSDEQAKNVKLETEFSEFKDAAYKLRDIVGEKLIEESDNRGWCDEFDKIISEVNDQLRWDLQLPTREKTYNVTWTEEFTVVVSKNIEVTAASEEGAIDQAKNDYGCADNWEIKNAVDCGNWTLIDSDYYTVEN